MDSASLRELGWFVIVTLVVNVIIIGLLLVTADQGSGNHACAVILTAPILLFVTLRYLRLLRTFVDVELGAERSAWHIYICEKLSIASAILSIGCVIPGIQLIAAPLQLLAVAAIVIFSLMSSIRLSDSVVEDIRIQIYQASNVTSCVLMLTIFLASIGVALAIFAQIYLAVWAFRLSTERELAASTAATMRMPWDD